MKLKYTGIYAPNSTWEEYFYHVGSVLIQNGVVETDDDIVIDTLLKSGFVPYEEWEAEDKARREEEAAKNDELVRKQIEEAAERLRQKKARTAKRAEAQESDEVVTVIRDDEIESFTFEEEFAEEDGQVYREDDSVNEEEVVVVEGVDDATPTTNQETK